MPWSIIAEAGHPVLLGLIVIAWIVGLLVLFELAGRER